MIRSGTRVIVTRGKFKGNLGKVQRMSTDAHEAKKAWVAFEDETPFAWVNRDDLKRYIGKPQKRKEKTVFEREYKEELILFDVMYFSFDDEEITVQIEAEDAASALGMVIDEHEDNILPGTPFVVDLHQDMSELEDDPDDDPDGGPPDGDDGEPNVIIEKDTPNGGAKIIELFPKREKQRRTAESR